MSLSGYQVEALLKDFRQRYGYKRTPEYREDSLDISPEAQYEAHRLQNYYRRPPPARAWVTPQNIFDLIADTQEYQAIIEYEQQRRAGLFVDPVYMPPHPPPAINLVHDYSAAIDKAQEGVDAPQTSAAQPGTVGQTPEDRPKKITKTTQKATDTLQSIDIEEGADDFLMEEDTSDSGEDNGVVFGEGRINLNAMIEFIQQNTDSAIKFIAQRDLDGKNLAADIMDIHEQWRQRGLSRRAIRDYILEIMEWETVPDRPLYDIWSEVRDRIYDLQHQGVIQTE